MANEIGRITTGGVVTEYPIPDCQQPTRIGITAGPDGALWFTEIPSGNKIGRITTAGLITEYPVPTANSYPCGITAGPDGALWFTESAGNNIGRAPACGLGLGASFANGTVTLNFSLGAPPRPQPGSAICSSARAARGNCGLSLLQRLSRRTLSLLRWDRAFPMWAR